ncbi:MAG: restriction endonuclease subunit S [Thermoplasmata archaeon]
MNILFYNFDLLLNASNSIEKLREVVLQLAVQGKLVPQDPKDEPASVLLEKIKKEKEWLIKEGKIKKSKSAPDFEKDKVPFEIPEQWVWSRVGELGITQTGTTPKKSEKSNFGNDYPFIKPGDIYSNRVEYNNEGLSKKGVDTYGRLASEGSILMVCIGTLGKVNVIDRPCSFNQQINAITPFSGLDPYLINYFMRSNYFHCLTWDNSSSTTLSILNKGKWESLPFPVPPHEEQKRIVAKIDQLMALCDELEGKQQKAWCFHFDLNESVLNALLNSKDSAEFEGHWQLIRENFDKLYTTIENVKDLRQALLQFAVQGKLVPQDPNDEPASVLIEKIKAEKEQLPNEGKIKKSKPLPPIEPDEVPYMLPKGWEWVRFQEVIDVRDGTHDSPKYVEDGIPLITSRCFENGQINFELANKISLEDHKKIIKRSLVEKDDILFSMIGGNLGNMVKVDTEREFSVKNVALFKYYNRKLILPEYLYLFLKNFAYLIQKKSVGGAQPFVALGYFRKHLFSLPPLAEQERIVAKVDRLMKLCDELEAQIKSQKELSGKLLEAVVNNAFAA